MSPSQRAVYFRTQVLANLVINSVLNGVIALLAYAARPVVPLLEIAVDIQITVAIIALAVAWIAIAAARKQPGGRPALRRVERLPHAAGLRALVIMLGMLLLYGGLALTAPLALLSPVGLPGWGYIVFKTLYTGGCAACAAALAILSVFQETTP